MNFSNFNCQFRLNLFLGLEISVIKLLLIENKNENRRTTIASFRGAERNPRAGC